MTDQHPTPPLELVQQWSDAALAASDMFEVKMKFAAYAAQWGADQERLKELVERDMQEAGL